MTASGEPARVYSAFNGETVRRHVRWLAESHVDAVFLQRFSCELHSLPHRAFRDQVARSIQAGAEEFGRVFAVM